MIIPLSLSPLSSSTSSSFRRKMTLWATEHLCKQKITCSCSSSSPVTWNQTGGLPQSYSVSSLGSCSNASSLAIVSSSGKLNPIEECEDQKYPSHPTTLIFLYYHIWESDSALLRQHPIGVSGNLQVSGLCPHRIYCRIGICSSYSSMPFQKEGKFFRQKMCVNLKVESILEAWIFEALQE